MLISHSKKFIFFHLIKTGGKSITKALAEYISIDINPSKGKREIESTIKELMEHIDPYIKNCTNFEDLKPYPKSVLNYICSYLTQDLSSRTDVKLSMKYAFSNPGLFRSLFQSYINDDYPGIYSTIHTHDSARNGKEVLPADIFKNYFKFAFVRHPLDWMISIFFFFSQNKEQEPHDIFRDFKSFDEFIEFAAAQKKIDCEGINFFNINLKAPQRDFLLDDQGNWLVDYVGRFENLEEDFAKICQIIGIQKVNLPHINKSSHRHYLKYYTDKTKRQAYYILEEDFKTFNYKL